MKPTNLIFSYPNVIRLKNSFIIDFKGVGQFKYCWGLRQCLK
jgi:hypothetical protein